MRSYTLCPGLAWPSLAPTHGAQVAHAGQVVPGTRRAMLGYRSLGGFISDSLCVVMHLWMYMCRHTCLMQTVAPISKLRKANGRGMQARGYGGNGGFERADVAHGACGPRIGLALSALCALRMAPDMGWPNGSSVTPYRVCWHLA